MIKFAHLPVLTLLPLLLVIAVLMWRNRGRRPRMRYSSLTLLRGAGTTLRARLRGLPALMLLLGAALIIIAMARPQSAMREAKRYTEGIDIMLVIDVSDSMQALDFRPNRLEKAKQVIKDFIKGRRDDRIGVVIFGRDTFALAPLTQDYAALEMFVDRIDFDLVNGQATAIGMGLANAVDRLRASTAKSKVVILLTDGENNTGVIDPITAADIAKEFKVRVYTIGVGTISGYVDFPNNQPFGRKRLRIPSSLDVAQLTEIAEKTGGQFFHATDDASLEKIYAQIDRMERTRVEVSETQYFDELGHYLIIPALGLLLLAFALENTVFRTFP